MGVSPLRYPSSPSRPPSHHTRAAAPFFHFLAAACQPASSRYQQPRRHRSTQHCYQQAPPQHPGEQAAESEWRMIPLIFAMMRLCLCLLLLTTHARIQPPLPAAGSHADGRRRVAISACSCMLLLLRRCALKVLMCVPFAAASLRWSSLALAVGCGMPSSTAPPPKESFKKLCRRPHARGLARPMGHDDTSD